MVFPRSFLRQTLFWDLPGGEVASCTCAWDNTGGGMISIGDDVAAAFKTRADALWGAISLNYSGGTQYRGSRLVLVSVNNTTVETRDEAVTPSGGGSGSPPLPHEVAVVASLKTATFSRSGRGRLYLPGPATSNVTASARLSGTNQTSLADGMQSYLDHLTVGSDEFFSVVASVTKGQLYPVTTVAVGDVFDSQRRRRDALTEVLVSLAVS